MTEVLDEPVSWLHSRENGIADIQMRRSRHPDPTSPGHSPDSAATTAPDKSSLEILGAPIAPRPNFLAFAVGNLIPETSRSAFPINRQV